MEVEIGETDTAGTMYDKLKSLGAQLLARELDKIVAGNVQRIPQDHAQATYAPNITREDEWMDWNRPAREVYNHIRGLNPWPVAYTTWNGERIKLWGCAVPDEKNDDRAVREGDKLPGTIVRADSDGIEVVVADGTVRLTEVQPAGKRKMSAADFVRGANIEAGTRLGAER